MPHQHQKRPEPTPPPPRLARPSAIIITITPTGMDEQGNVQAEVMRATFGPLADFPEQVANTLRHTADMIEFGAAGRSILKPNLWLPQ